MGGRDYRMKKVVLLPLDERPCNYRFPYELFHGEEMALVRPEKLGDKKISACQEEVEAFLIKECKDADALVLSIDTLLYGGLIPSRLHSLSMEETKRRLSVVKRLKEENPNLVLYAFEVIMRCPKYSSDDEEPDYYGICGEEIHRIGNILHRSKLELCSEEELKELDGLYDKTGDCLKDYTDRRSFNLTLNLATLDYVNQQIIDFLIIPQDDSAKYGYTAMDQEIVRKRITELLLQDQVLMYPGADEIAMTLLARVANTFHKRFPKVYIKYSSNEASFLIPSYEDRTLGETIKYHLIAANCRMASSYSEADLVFAVNCPSGEMKESNCQPVKSQGYCVERNITEFILFLKDCIRDDKPVTIGDNAYANGADLELIALMNKNRLLDQVSGYAGWNTSSNTLGTALAEGVASLYEKDSMRLKSFLMSRYVEDAGYCSVVRKHIASEHLKELGMDYFHVEEQDGVVSELVKEHLTEFIGDMLSSVAGCTKLLSVWMPWKRMFEVGVTVRYEKPEM